jgi:hypothetical protein
VKTIRTSISIDAEPERIWAVLADFDSYAEWNPLNIRAAGKAVPGAKVAMTFINPARPGTTVAQVVTVTACEPWRRLEWVGQVPLLFRGRHFFELEPKPGGTLLRHGEDMSGLIALTFTRKKIEERFIPAYMAANRALATRVTALARNGG